MMYWYTHRGPTSKHCIISCTYTAYRVSDWQMTGYYLKRLHSGGGGGGGEGGYVVMGHRGIVWCCGKKGDHTYHTCYNDVIPSLEREGNIIAF